jgi:hypothetical protein
MSEKQNLDLANIWRKFKNPVLNKYKPLRTWEICSLGEINKLSNPWMKSLTYMPSLMTRKGNISCREPPRKGGSL